MATERVTIVNSQLWTTACASGVSTAPNGRRNCAVVRSVNPAKSFAAVEVELPKPHPYSLERFIESRVTNFEGKQLDKEERIVLNLIALDYTNKQIMKLCGFTAYSLGGLRKAMYEKIGITNKREAALYCLVGGGVDFYDLIVGLPKIKDSKLRQNLARRARQQFQWQQVMQSGAVRKQYDKLTSDEKQALTMFARGAHYEEIGNKFALNSRQQGSAFFSNIARQLGVGTAIEAAAAHIVFSNNLVFEGKSNWNNGDYVFLSKDGTVGPLDDLGEKPSKIAGKVFYKGEFVRPAAWSQDSFDYKGVLPSETAFSIYHEGEDRLDLTRPVGWQRLAERASKEGGGSSLGAILLRVASIIEQGQDETLPVERKQLLDSYLAACRQFLSESEDPDYQDVFERLFIEDARQKRLIEKINGVGAESTGWVS